MIMPMSHYIAAGVVEYNIASASYDSVTLDVSSEDTLIGQACFGDSGTKLYVPGRINDTVFQYTLPTAYALNSASYASKSVSVVSESGNPNAVSMSDDGTKMFVLDLGSNVYQYTLSTPWDVSTASYASKSFSWATQTTSELVMSFGDGGSKFYVSGFDGVVYQYGMTMNWDVSTASYASQSFTPSAQMSRIDGIHIREDGVKMFLLTSASPDTVFQYTLSTPWDVSSSSYDSVSFSVNPQTGGTCSGLVFAADGSKMLVCDGFIGEVIYQYSL
jgi:hypothetical protein